MQLSQKKKKVLATAPLPYLVIILNVLESEKVSFSDMQNLITVC